MQDRQTDNVSHTGSQEVSAHKPRWLPCSSSQSQKASPTGTGHPPCPALPSRLRQSISLAPIYVHMRALQCSCSLGALAVLGAGQMSVHCMTRTTRQHRGDGEYY